MVSDRLNRELYGTLVMIVLIILVALLHGCGGSDDESACDEGRASSVSGEHGFELIKN